MILKKNEAIDYIKYSTMPYESYKNNLLDCLKDKDNYWIISKIKLIKCIKRRRLPK